MSGFSICETPKARTFADYCNYLYEYVARMFIWHCDFAPDYIFERYLIQSGQCAIYKPDNGAPIVIHGNYSGTSTEYLPGSQYVGTTLDGKTYTGNVGENIAVLWNNHTLTGDISTISAYASRFVESDKSILNVLRGARITALVTATDNTDKLTLDNVVKAINDGETVVKVPPAYREIDALDNGAKRFDILRLTDPKDTDKLQYLTRYRDDLLSAFLNEYGLSVECVNKMAQVSVSELHSMDNATAAIVESRLECRSRQLDIVRSWGYDISVEKGVARGVEFTANENKDDQEVEENAETV